LIFDESLKRTVNANVYISYQARNQLVSITLKGKHTQQEFFNILEKISSKDGGERGIRTLDTAYRRMPV